MRSSTTIPNVRSAGTRHERAWLSLVRHTIRSLLTAAIVCTGMSPATYGADTLPTRPPPGLESSAGVPDVASQLAVVEPRTPIRRGAEQDAGRAVRGATGSLTGSLATLGLILAGLYVLLLWLRRRETGHSGSATAAIDVIASRRLDAQGSLHLVRVGRRVLAIGTGTNGMQTLAAFDDPEEVALLIEAGSHSTAAGGRERSPHRGAPANTGRDESTPAAAAAAGTTSLGRVA